MYVCVGVNTCTREVSWLLTMLRGTSHDTRSHHLHVLYVLYVYIEINVHVHIWTYISNMHADVWTFVCHCLACFYGPITSYGMGVANCEVAE